MIRGAPAGGRPGPGGGPGGGGFMGMGGPPPAKIKDFRGTVLRLFRRVSSERAWMISAVILTAIGVALNVVGPKILGTATNILFNGLIGKSLPHGIPKSQLILLMRQHGKRQLADMLSGMNVIPGVGVDWNAFALVLMLAVGTYLVGAAFTWGQGYILAGVAQRTVYRMRRDVEAKLDRLPLAYFDTHERGDILSRVTNDIDNIGTTLQQGLGQLLNSLLTVVGVLGIMFWIDWQLASVSLVMVPMSALVTFLIARQSQRRFAAQWRWTGRLNAHVEEMHTGHSLVQAFGYREKALGDFDSLNQQLYGASFSAQFLSGIVQPAMQLVSNLNYVAIAVIGGWKVASGTMTLGDVQAFIQYSRQFTMPLMQLAAQVNLLQSGFASAERVFEFLDAEEEVPDRADAKILADVEGRVRFEDVSFRYEPAKPLIEEFDFEVAPGQTIAIVGPTGAGKTTIVNLLMRFYDVGGGSIKVDGVDIRDIRRDSLRSSFGMVLQDTWLFSGTIRENIAYGKNGATDEEVVEAAQQACFDHFVRTLPDGYATHIDDDAANLSAGQRQLLTIARAFIADPAILILDEATSSVDTRTEVLIQEAMARLRHGRTSFVIAHRLSTIRNADQIMVMDRGRIVETGTHEELLAKGGFYHDLYQSQFSEAFAEAG
jgi:ATP-binding cassette, subfamily B, multidrug efflux pump